MSCCRVCDSASGMRVAYLGVLGWRSLLFLATQAFFFFFFRCAADDTAVVSPPTLALLLTHRRAANR